VARLLSPPVSLFSPLPPEWFNGESRYYYLLLSPAAPPLADLKTPSPSLAGWLLLVYRFFGSFFPPFLFESFSSRTFSFPCVFWKRQFSFIPHDDESRFPYSFQSHPTTFPLPRVSSLRPLLIAHAYLFSPFSRLGNGTSLAKIPFMPSWSACILAVFTV